MTEIETLENRIQELTAALADLYWWVEELPVKHPQQAEKRDRAAELLGIYDKNSIIQSVGFYKEG